MQEDDEKSEQKLIALSPLWAGMLASIMVAAAVGTFAFAWNLNASYSVLNDRVEHIEKADTASRLQDTQTRIAVLEQKVEGVKVGVADIQNSVNETGKKLDVLLLSDAQQRGTRKRGDE